MKEREGGGGGEGGTEFHAFSSNFTQNSIPCALSTFFDIYSFFEVKFCGKVIVSEEPTHPAHPTC